MEACLKGDYNKSGCIKNEHPRNKASEQRNITRSNPDRDHREPRHNPGNPGKTGSQKPRCGCYATPLLCYVKSQDAANTNTNGAPKLQPMPPARNSASAFNNCWFNPQALQRLWHCMVTTGCVTVHRAHQTPIAKHSTVTCISCAMAALGLKNLSLGQVQPRNCQQCHMSSIIFRLAPWQ